jgi:hypothetical protein
MIILKEMQKFDEMALRVISSPQDGLPFRIIIQSPDHQPPHAHIKDLETGKKEEGQFEIPKNMPRIPEDIKNYKQGITDAMRQLIFSWMKNSHRKQPKLNNLEALQLDWSRNE